MIDLGVTVSDRITGFRGVVTGKVQYISGCTQVLVQPRVGVDGKRPDGEWFDEQRVEVDDLVPAVKLDNSAAAGFDALPPVR